jgi:alkylation response protein AidB-like acyl-CoA dehydrogenase
MAFTYASEAAAAVTKRAVQYHGAYGFSAEYDVQLYYRRARGWPLVLWGASTERQRLADLLWPREET